MLWLENPKSQLQNFNCIENWLNIKKVMSKSVYRVSLSWRLWFHRIWKNKSKVNQTREKSNKKKHSQSQINSKVFKEEANTKVSSSSKLQNFELLSTPLICIPLNVYIVYRTFNTFDMRNKDVKSNLLCVFLFLTTSLTLNVCMYIVYMVPSTPSTWVLLNVCIVYRLPLTP